MSAREQLHDSLPARTIRHELSLRSLLSVVGLVFSIWLVLRLWRVLLLIVVALVLAGTLSPVVTWLERRGMRRVFALSLVLIALLAAVIGLGALVIPALATQISDLVKGIPVIKEQLADYVAGIPALADRAEGIRQAQPSTLLAPLGGHALSYASAATEIVVLGLTTVVLAFYLLADHERVQGFAFALLPRQYHLRTARILLDMETIVGGYVRGQALTSLLIGGFTALLLAILGVPNALAFGVFAAFADLIPFVGAALAVAPPVMAALVRGPGTALIALVVLVIYHQFESHLLIPRVYGRTLRLAPAAVMIALLVGGELLGIVGALLALPLAAGIRVLIQDLRIDLPGEQTGEETQRGIEDEFEEAYARQAVGTSAVEAAMLATAMAETFQATPAATSGPQATPVEDQHDAPAAQEVLPTLPGDLAGRPHQTLIATSPITTTDH